MRHGKFAKKNLKSLWHCTLLLNFKRENHKKSINYPNKHLKRICLMFKVSSAEGSSITFIKRGTSKEYNCGSQHFSSWWIFHLLFAYGEIIFGLFYYTPQARGWKIFLFDAHEFGKILLFYEQKLLKKVEKSRNNRRRLPYVSLLTHHFSIYTFF